MGVHFPLYFVVGANLTKSRRSRGADVKAEWRTNLDWSWPWWVQHESEKMPWLPGFARSGRGYSGPWCLSGLCLRCSVLSVDASGGPPLVM